jgi:hypothetical protein
VTLQLRVRRTRPAPPYPDPSTATPDLWHSPVMRPRALLGTTISCRRSAYSCWRRFWDLDQLPSAREQLPPARTIAREELYGADLGSFGPFCACTYLRPWPDFPRSVFMRAAADLEDASEKHVAMENRLYPMRELLADMLMAQGEAAAALKEYEGSLQNAPMRLRGFYGAAKAAEAVGDARKANEYFAKLARLTKGADSERPELREARQRMTKR